MRSYPFIAFIFICLFTITSCWRETSPEEGLNRYRDKNYRYNIDYPIDSCKTSLDNQGSLQVLTIADNDNNYRIQVLSIKSEQDKRYKFTYYTTVDTLFYKRGELQSETKEMFNDRIVRTYSVNKYITMETTSIYGVNCIYVIYSEYNEDGKESACKIKESFKTSSGIGPINFCKRKLYALIGDNTFSTVLSYIIFSVLLTLLFWGGIVLCFSFDDPIVGFLAIAIYIVAFALFAVTDQFMGYVYGHNNLWHLIVNLLLLFNNEG